MRLPAFYRSPGIRIPPYAILGQLYQIKTDTPINSTVKNQLWTSFVS
jgi:hypothetical protein